MATQNKNLLLTFIKKLFNKILNQIFKKQPSRKKPENKETENKTVIQAPDSNKSHSWRTCPIGEHWVITHPMWVPPTDNRSGYITTRDGHCAANPPRKNGKIIEDYLTQHEMHLIAETHFKYLTGPPTSGKLTAYPDSDKYDVLIRGWTKYWNDIFKPDEPLDPDLVKALIATESDFRLNPPEQNAGAAGIARGLIQLTDQTMKALGDPKGELINHLVKIAAGDISDPNICIAAGVRWLFRKRELASRRLNRIASWEDAAMEYKAYTKKLKDGESS
ncbi:MAG: lytic transglycosylase domain-containing protein, partial [Bdellovibrionales bacterium]|nr:lytic transglycosylase domain-containing protein [Bdellovibrionales bacterium]